MFQANPHFGTRARRLAILFAALVLAHPAGANDLGPTVNDEPDAARKFQQGLAGVTLGILEVPGTIVEQTRENGPIVGLAMGLTQGVGRFVTRELVGVYQMFTAPFRGPSGTQDPEFPWQRFDYGSRSHALDREAVELAGIRGIELEKAHGALVVTFPGDLLFDTGSARISRAAEPRLIGLAETLQRYPDTQVEVLGHTDATGPAAVNEALSRDRAEAVREFLLTQGLEAGRIHTIGLGASRPIASNETGDGRRANRRVEVQLTKSVASLD